MNMQPGCETAIVTGGASGIGAAFCRALAARAFRVVIVDRDAPAALLVAEEINKVHGVVATVRKADLTSLQDIELVAAELREMPRVDILVNCAGFGTSETFEQSQIERQIDMVHVHVVASVRLCHAVLAGMIARNAGWIINLASVNAFTRSPRMATYCGCKLFLVGFSECLQTEVAGTKIRIQALCPGNIRTKFFQSAGISDVEKSRVPEALWMSPQDLVHLSLAALSKGSGTFVAGWKNRIYLLVFGSAWIQPILRTLRRWGVLEMALKLVKRR